MELVTQVGAEVIEEGRERDQREENQWRAEGEDRRSGDK